MAVGRLSLGRRTSWRAARRPEATVRFGVSALTSPASGWVAAAAEAPALPEHQVRVVIADDQRLLRTGFRVILDAGPTPGPVPSTIVDCTTDQGRVLRQGALPLERLNEIAGGFDTEIVDEG